MTPVRQLVATSVVVLVCASAAAGQAMGQGEPSAPDPVTDAGCSRLVDYATTNFGIGLLSRDVRHRLLPLEPGTQRVFEGRSNATGNVLPHRVTFTVTSLTKVVDGHRGAVVWDVDESDGAIAETELAIFAQDLSDNVWNLGEYPEEYPDGVFEGAPSTWFAGIEDAEPGIHMLATPAVGLPEYLQGSVPSIEFLDCATIVQTGATVCVPAFAGCLKDVLVIHERSPLDPAGGIQVKYHAPGVGIVQIGAVGDPEGETLVLTEFNRLTPSELQAANREAHVLDQRGLHCSEVYAQSQPVEGPDDGVYGPFTCAQPEPPEPPEPAPAMGGATTAAPFSAAAATPAAAQQLLPAPSTPRRGRYVAEVDHPLFPLSKVRTMLYEGSEGGDRIRVRARVQTERVRVAGARATAVRVTERENGELVERATDYFAQDRGGNVWYLGERVDNVENGKVVDHDGQWVAGRNGARRGLFMPAAPQVGRSFRPTRAPGVSQDRSTVVALDAAVTTPAGRFTGCLRTREKDLRSSDPAEHKVYCPEVGLVRERPSDGKVDLVSFR